MYVMNTYRCYLHLKQQTSDSSTRTLADLPTQPSSPAGVSKAQVPLKAIRDKLFCPDQNQGWHMSRTASSTGNNVETDIPIRYTDAGYGNKALK